MTPTLDTGTDPRPATFEGVCDGTGDVHEPMTWADFLERAKRWTAYVTRMDREATR